MAAAGKRVEGDLYGDVELGVTPKRPVPRRGAHLDVGIDAMVVDPPALAFEPAASLRTTLDARSATASSFQPGR